MQRVLVVDKNKQPLMPCRPARARELLKSRKAAVFRRFPFTIILKEREGGDTQPLVLKFDPGSKVTGLSVVADFRLSNCLVWAAELSHRGQNICNALLHRRQLRSSRRQRKTRYRPARHSNRTKPKGWLPPSLRSRIENVWTWTLRLSRFCPLSSLSLELLRFDTQLMQNAETSGLCYQQGELQGYEIREYQLEKWHRKCAYCGKQGVPLEIEHIVPKTRGGSSRISNLSLACHVCNQLKGSQTAAEFGYPDIQEKAKRPLKDAAALNSTRWALFYRLKLTGLPIEVGTGGRTKFNRIRQGYPKTHWIDAGCVGESGACVYISKKHVALIIEATGHGRRQRCRTDAYGFPKAHAPRAKMYAGFQTGDMVKAIIPIGKFAGTHIGRIGIRFRPSFRLKEFDVHPKYLRLIHQADGYVYQKGS